jgi:hypothetical protein
MRKFFSPAGPLERNEEDTGLSFGLHPLRNCSSRLRKKSGKGWKYVPQRLEPYLFSIVYVRAEARTLQTTELFRSLLRIGSR